MTIEKMEKAKDIQSKIVYKKEKNFNLMCNDFKKTI